MKRIVTVSVLVVAGLFGGVTASSVGAATSTTVTWKVSSLTAGQVKSLSAVAATNSPGVKTWSKTGSCVLSLKSKPPKLTMGTGTSCKLTLKIAKSGKYPAKTSTKIIAQKPCANGGVCAVGDKGPGGGTVFYVDTEGRYNDFDYLEVAPAAASTDVEWSTTTPHCGLLANESCQNTYLTTEEEVGNYVAMGTGRAATAAIIARHDAGGVPKADYAAGVADTYTTPTASDWFLPSKDELNEMCKYARNTGQAAGGDIQCAGGILRVGFSDISEINLPYWSSSYDLNNDFDNAEGVDVQYFNSNPDLINPGGQPIVEPRGVGPVRPIRAF